MILDKYPRTEKDKRSGTEGFNESPASDVRAEESAKTGQRRPAASEVNSQLKLRAFLSRLMGALYLKTSSGWSNNCHTSNFLNLR
jgi:hypothetical protein